MRKSAPGNCWRSSACPTKRTPTRLSSPAARSSASPLPAVWRLNPKILLCDEATSALDPKTTRDILRLSPGHQPAAGHHSGGHHPRDGRGGGDLLPRGHSRPRRTAGVRSSVEEVFSNPKTEAGRRLVYPRRRGHGQVARRPTSSASPSTAAPPTSPSSPPWPSPAA